MAGRSTNWQTNAGGFVSTHWTEILASASEDVAPEAAETALANLYRDYWPPLYAFVRRRGHNAHDAQDLTQSFFAYLLESKAYARADRSKGKFRSFLLGMLKYFLAGTREREGRQKRGGGQQFVFLNAEAEAPDALLARDLAGDVPLDEDRFFERHWAAVLVDRAMAALRAEYAGETKAAVLTTLSPFLKGGVHLPSQAEAAQQLGVSLETLRSHLSRLRARYRELLRAEVARTVVAEDNIDDELRYLCRVLINNGGG